MSLLFKYYIIAITADGVPPDGRPIRVLDATHIATFIVFISLFGVLLLVAIGCVLFNIIFRNNRYISVLGVYFS